LPPDEAFELKPGDVLANRFRIEQVLGMGGMGIVAAAWHLELRTRVALKLLLPSASVDEAAVERFSREASALSRMRSEYVVRVFDVGRLPDGGPPFMVMEQLIGEDLESLIVSRGRIAPEEAVGYTLHACEGIAEAHSLGIVHRDLKPANLFLTRRVDGSKLVKVVDFGIAKERSGAASAKLTGPLIAMGSPQYMSPEQSRAADVDPRTDIWSLGVCLYEMLTGVPPFDAPSVAEITAAVLRSDPRSPEAVRSDLPAALSAIVMRCLQKMPAARFADVAELAEALEQFATSEHRGSAARMRLVLGKRPELRARRAPEPGIGDRETPLEAPPPEDRARELEAPPPEDRGGEQEAPPIKSWSAGAPLAGAPTPKRRALVLALALGAVGLLATGAAWMRASSRGAEPTTMSSAPPPAAAPSGEDLPPIAIQVASGRPLASAAPRASAGLRGAPPGGKKPARPGSASAPLPDPAPEPPAPATATSTAAIATATAAAPRFVVASARVDVGSATSTFGTTPMNVNRVIAPLAERMTACYRAALPQMAEPGGAATLHIETDEDGVIISARIAGASSGPGACIRGAVVGRRLPNVDTGRARADIPLVFRAQ
jgi:serine/threonine-protein kinase